MKIRPYHPEQDFEAVGQWMTDPRMHAMWCANRFPYPADAAEFSAALEQICETGGDEPYVAADENDHAIGFFCCALNAEEIMLKFVAVDRTLRGQGIGTEMVRLAVQYIFDHSNAKAVQLNVFSGNPAAKKCYLKAGFAERSVTPAAFRFADEAWDRCNMVIYR